MIEGVVNDEGAPIVPFEIAGHEWPAVIDTGFNGDLQLPEACRASLNPSYFGKEFYILANNETIEEDTYLVQLSFDGETVTAMVSFIVADEILMGTHFLRNHRMIVDFVARTVHLERVQTN